MEPSFTQNEYFCQAKAKICHLFSLERILKMCRIKIKRAWIGKQGFEWGGIHDGGMVFRRRQRYGGMTFRLPEPNPRRETTGGKISGPLERWMRCSIVRPGRRCTEISGCVPVRKKNSGCDQIAAASFFFQFGLPTREIFKHERFVEKNSQQYLPGSENFCLNRAA